MDIPGLKSLRLLAVQPIALLPVKGIDQSRKKEYFMELTFDSGSILNVPITEQTHGTYLRFMKRQGTTVSQAVSARNSVPSSTEHFAPKEHFVPIAGPVNLEEELRKAQGYVDPLSPTLPPGPEGAVGPGPCPTGPTGPTG